MPYVNGKAVYSIEEPYVDEYDECTLRSAEKLESNLLWDEDSSWKPLAIFHSETLADEERSALKQNELETWPTNVDEMIALYKRRWLEDCDEATKAGCNEWYKEPHSYKYLEQLCCPYAQIDERTGFELVSNGDSTQHYRHAVCCADCRKQIGPD
jgi:hypothetical protein